MEKKALVVGINEYEHVPSLKGCVYDARRVYNMLDRDEDGSKNFHIELKVTDDKANPVERSNLRIAIEQLFAGDAEIALLYFAGHGFIESTGGFLCASDAKDGHDGIALSDIMTWANNSSAKHKIIILDSCHAGGAGSRPTSQISEIGEGVTILAASTAQQLATEQSGAGVFTNLLVDALEGGAANLLGQITPGSVYAHIDQSLGPWAQRPVFKANIKKFISLRAVEPPLAMPDLQRIADLFPCPDHEFRLDPTYEPERSEQDIKAGTLPPPDPEKTPIFEILQKYNRVNLVVPLNAPHMWHAAMERKACGLTRLGKHYRRLVEEETI